LLVAPEVCSIAVSCIPQKLDARQLTDVNIGRHIIQQGFNTWRRAPLKISVIRDGQFFSLEIIIVSLVLQRTTISVAIISLIRGRRGKCAWGNIELSHRIAALAAAKWRGTDR